MRPILICLLFISANLSAQDWVQSNGPFGGEIRAMAINSSGHLFAGTPTGIVRSLDNGDTWTEANNGITERYVWDIAITPNDHVFVTYGTAVYRSTNNGASWVQLTGIPPSASVRSLTTSVSGAIMAGNSFGTLRSIDDGNTWSVHGPLTFNIDEIVITPGDTVYATQGFGGFGSSLFRSPDLGASWTELFPPFLGGSTHRLALNPAGHIFIAGDWFGILRSEDAGNSWTLLNQLTASQALVFDANGIAYAAQSFGVMRSVDNGDTWTAANTGIEKGEVHVLAVNASGHVFAGLFYCGGVYRTTNGGADWTRTSEGIRACYVTSLTVNSNNHYFAGTHGEGVFRSVDGGFSWQPINIGVEEPYITSLAVNSANDLFLGTRTVFSIGGVYRSLDNGATWTYESDSLVINQVGDLLVASNGAVLALLPNGLYRSADNGDTWSFVNNGSCSTGTSDLALGPNNTLYGATWHPCALHVMRSLDDGLQWASSGTGYTGNTGNTRSTSCSSDTVLLIRNSAMHRSVDDGLTWTDITSSSTPFNIQAFQCDAQQSRVFAGTQTGVLISHDNGDSWVAVNDGLTSLDALAMAQDQNGTILVGTRYGGVFLSTASVSTREQVSSPSHLDQNVPNPCNSQSTIRFELTEVGPFTVVLMDAQGRLVRTLMNGSGAPGPRTIDIDVSALESGIYYYSLDANGQRSTRRMAVVH